MNARHRNTLSQFKACYSITQCINYSNRFTPPNGR